MHNFKHNFLPVVASLILTLSLVPENVVAEAVPVALTKTQQGWQLTRGGEPYFIRGAGGTASLDQLAKSGANSVRTWDADNIDELLGEAHALGLTVTVGIWLGHERHGFDYGNKSAVKKQLERARQAVLRYKDHPAVLMWGVGNEMEGFEAGGNPQIWAAVNDVAAMIKELDPHHPTMTVTAEIGGDRVASLNEHCPAIDIHGINSYGGAQSLAERYRAAGATRPYVITEFGPPGSWEVVRNDWGAPVEPTSSEKGEYYRRSYEQGVLAQKGLALGSYAFNWGHKMEGTATWFGMFLPDGSPLAAVDVMTELWSGSRPANLAPSIEALKILGSAQVDPGAEVTVRSAIKDPEGERLNVRWAMRHESNDYLTGGDFRATLPDVEGAVLQGDASGARVLMPVDPGPYRLFVYAHDETGKAATANVPLRVKGEARTPMPFYVYDEGLEGMPWAPSGWMGNIDALTLDGDHKSNPFDGEHCIQMRYLGPRQWVAVAWQHPPNNWGVQDGGFDLSGAKYLELWARGEYGGEQIKLAVGLLGSDTAYPDSGIAKSTSHFLTDEWQRYRVPLRRVDLSSIKTGLVVTINGRPSSVTVYLDKIRFVR